MGGAYELFYLVKDDQDLGDMAVEILCAHIRRLTSEEEYRKTYRSRPSEEVQSLLSLLFMQEHNVFDCYYINLRGAWLNGADFSRARLQDANLDAAQLQGAYLFEADLRGAILDNAQLQMALLPHANLHAASLDATNLQGASLDNTHLQGATLVKAQLQEASLTETDLRGVRSQVLSSDSDKTVRELVDSSGFEEEIRSSIGKETDLSGAILVGGLTQEAIDSFLSNLPKVDSQELSGLLELHIGMTASHELPEDSCAIIGAYSKTDAAKWISEYEDASG